MGLGLHGGGVGAANYFIEHGYNIVITDLKKEEELKESIDKLKQISKCRFVLGRHEFKDFKDADLIIKNPAVPQNSPYIKYAHKNGVSVDTDVGVFLDAIKNTTKNIIGVTGTKGKSTVATLTHKIFATKYSDAVLCGNITVSVFDVIEHIKIDTPLIIELSSFQLGGIREKRYSPKIAVFTNFFEDHLDYYRSMDEYFEDKSVLYRFQHPGDLLVYNRDDNLADIIKKNKGVSTFTFGMEENFSIGRSVPTSRAFPANGTFIRQGKVYYKKDGKVESVVDIESIPLKGSHNLYNVMAAITAAMAEGVPRAEIEHEVKAFRGLEHRLELIGQKTGVSFYNDSAATNPEAAVRGIKTFSEPVILIAGGYDKGLSLKEFIRVINQSVKHLMLLEGNGTERLVKEGVKKEFHIFDNIRDAVKQAYEISRPSEIVLLSPGFASFGMFRNEFHRGDEFRRIVNEIIKEKLP
ncbi:MAG: UDP-N-acetylmuramoyl-L-alanine--D-glutamate ligase [Spirochaetota bacterium]|nr:MAG: UDP-N-acetylmuramoyl-L-alanine--D-glutamate ligase [Spirochaetota bacterium]